MSVWVFLFILDFKKGLINVLTYHLRLHISLPWFIYFQIIFCDLKVNREKLCFGSYFADFMCSDVFSGMNVLLSINTDNSNDSVKYLFLEVIYVLLEHLMTFVTFRA